MQEIKKEYKIGDIVKHFDGINKTEVFGIIVGKVSKETYKIYWLSESYNNFLHHWYWKSYNYPINFFQGL